MLEKYDRDFLTVQEVTRELGSDENTVRLLLRTGELPGKKIGCRWYVAKDWLMEPSNQQGRNYAKAN